MIVKPPIMGFETIIMKELRIALKVKSISVMINFITFLAWLHMMMIIIFGNITDNYFIYSFGVFAFLGLVGMGIAVWGFWYTTRTLSRIRDAIRLRIDFPLQPPSHNPLEKTCE